MAAHLGDALLEQLVFVGGAVASLLSTDLAMPDIRHGDSISRTEDAISLSLILDYDQVNWVAAMSILRKPLDM